jgi:hypothetical protein
VEVKPGERARFRGDKIEKIPLRHEGDVLALGREVGEVGHGPEAVADLDAYTLHLVVTHLQEIVEIAELMHQLERGGMDCVASEIAQEITMLFQHGHVDSGPREQKPEHHAGRPAPDDATACRDHGLAP